MLFTGRVLYFLFFLLVFYFIFFCFFTFFFLCPWSTCHRQRSNVKTLRSGDFNFPRQRIFSITSYERIQTHSYLYNTTRPSSESPNKPVYVFVVEWFFLIPCLLVVILLYYILCEDEYPSREDKSYAFHFCPLQ